MKQQGKQSLPYLLSTTKTLARCKRYYYNDLEFKFNCKRNRDCYTERNVRINITRIWHNVIIPNAIISRENGCPPTYKEALVALNYAMSHGKTPRSLAMWKHVCEAEAKLNGSPESIVYKFQRSFYYYALGQAISKEGLVYNLPKSKVFTVKTYQTEPGIIRFIYQHFKLWKCPWDDLNMLVYKWLHYADDYKEKCQELNDKIDDLKSELRHTWEEDEREQLSARIKDAENELYILDEPDFPLTQRGIVSEFHVSRTSAARFLLWKKQLLKYDHGAYYDQEKISWPLPKSLRNGKEDDSEPDFVDTETGDDSGPDVKEEDSIEAALLKVANSGERPVGRVDDAVLPF